jgi:mRNA interferase MazF
MNRGEVVLVDWPYSDRTGGKIRPAVVVQADYLNGLLDDTVLVHITSKKHGIPGTEVELNPASETASGLLRISYAFCPNVLTADPAYIDSTIGVLSDRAMRKIEECLKSTLGIP